MCCNIFKKKCFLLNSLNAVRPRCAAFFCISLVALLPLCRYAFSLRLRKSLIFYKRRISQGFQKFNQVKLFSIGKRDLVF